MSFVHLHCHTEYSLLDGLARTDDIIAKAKKHNMPAVAITDHGSLYGAFQLYIKAKDAGIKAIIGVEAYKAKRSRHDKEGGQDRDQNHLVLLAMNLTGYKNLLKIVTAAHLEGFYYKPRIDFELLEQYNEGLICLTGCLNGEVPELILQNQIPEAEQKLQQYHQIFGDRLYLELQRHPGMEENDIVNKELIRMSRTYGIPVVATNDVHYLNKEDAYAQEILLCIQTLRTIHEHNRPLSMIENPDFYFKTPDEMATLFADLPEAIENAVRIADRCELEIPHGKMILPAFPLPEGITPEQQLRENVRNGIDRVKNFDQEVVQKRIEYELSVIVQKGYANYFLVVSDFVNWAKKEGIAVGPGRGSAAGSLVSYCLRITDINPLTYNLPFERFLNPGRPSPPDIDIDFADRRRDEVIQYVRKRYGDDHVAQIITFGTMESRLAVRDVARALGMSYGQADRIAKMIPPPRQGFHMKLKQAIEETAELKLAYNSEPETKQVLDVAQRLESMPRHASVHAAGVIIADKPLVEYVPLQREPKEEKIITQFDMYNLDLNAVSDNKAVGLMKMDFLGLRNLTILEDALRFVKESKGLDVDIHEVPLDDPKTFELISNGDTVGVFQLESAGMRRLAKDLKPEKISDIIAMVALFRPGPMDLIPSFIEGKANPKRVRYPHKDLKPVLEETYGILVYQEQVMNIAAVLAGFSMSEADLLRMAVGKKKKSLMEKGKKNFIEGCVKNGYTKILAEKIFGFIEKFAAYGFNKAHAASYALIAYWTAYMKANYPVEFMTALLTAELQGVAGPMREIKMAQTLEECKKMEIVILPPDITKSIARFKIEDGGIRFGLSAIKNVGEAAIDSIVETRDKQPFVSFTDFLKRVDLRRVNKKTVESLIKAGGFSAFGNRATLLANYPELVKEISATRETQDKGQFDLFTDAGSDAQSQDLFTPIPEVTEDEIYAMEKEVIGFLINKNPLAKFQEIIEKKATKKVGEVSLDDQGQKVVLVGIVSGRKIIKTKKDNLEMAFLTVFDETGSVEVIVFPKLFVKFRDILNINQVIIFKGTVSEKEDQINVLLDVAMKLG